MPFITFPDSLLLHLTAPVPASRCPFQYQRSLKVCSPWPTKTSAYALPKWIERWIHPLFFWFTAHLYFNGVRTLSWASYSKIEDVNLVACTLLQLVCFFALFAFGLYEGGSKCSQWLAREDPIFIISIILIKNTRKSSYFK